MRRLGRKAENFSVSFPVNGNTPESGSLWTLSTATESFSFRVCYLPAAASPDLAENHDSSSNQRITFPATVPHLSPKFS